MFLNFNNFRHFNLIVNNLLNRDVSRNFLDDFNNSLNYSLMRHDSLLNSFELYELVYDFLNNSVDFNVDVLLNDHFFNFGLKDWYLNNFLDFLNSLFNHDLGYNSFNNLRNLYYFLYNTRHHNNFLNYLFNFNNFWYFNHLLNNLLDWNLDLFDTVDMS